MVEISWDHVTFPPVFKQVRGGEGADETIMAECPHWLRSSLGQPSVEINCVGWHSKIFLYYQIWNNIKRKKAWWLQQFEMSAKLTDIEELILNQQWESKAACMADGLEHHLSDHNNKYSQYSIFQTCHWYVHSAPSIVILNDTISRRPGQQWGSPCRSCPELWEVSAEMF